MQATIYIRKENEEFWNSLKDKSGWVNKTLEQRKSTKTPLEDSRPVVPAPRTKLQPDPITGYPCCSSAKPCKHWEYNGLNSTWTNTITGEIKEVA